MLKLYGSGRMKNGRKQETSEERDGCNAGDSNPSESPNSECLPANPDATASSMPSSHSNSETAVKRHPGAIRLQKELQELDLPPCCRIDFRGHETEKFLEGSSPSSWLPGNWMSFGWTGITDQHQQNGNEISSSSQDGARDIKKSLLSCTLHVIPDEGFWKGAVLSFQMTVPTDYPHVPPKVRCMTKIYHPNIDLEGNICLNILREDWKPVLSLSSVIYGILHLFLEPNPNDPLNQEAARTLREDIQLFSWKVSQALRGRIVDGEKFPKLL